MTPIKDHAHKLEKLIINRNNIDELVKIKTARELHESQVIKIKRLLDNGGHFSSPMVANTVIGNGGQEKNELIDGNNRTEAIRRKIYEDPGFSIEVDFVRYANLTPSQKIEVFDRFNQGVRVNKQDMMVMHQNELPAIRDLIREYPVQLDVGKGVIDRNSPFMKLSTIVNAHVSAKKKYTLSSALTVRWQSAKELDRKDCEIMISFGADLKEFASDQYQGKNKLMRIPAITVIYRAWYLNCVELPFMGTMDESRKSFSNKAWDILHWEKVRKALSDANYVSKGTLMLVAEHEFIDAANHNSSGRMKYPSEFYGHRPNEVD